MKIKVQVEDTQDYQGRGEIQPTDPHFLDSLLGVDTYLISFQTSTRAPMKTQCSSNTNTYRSPTMPQSAWKYNSIKRNICKVTIFIVYYSVCDTGLF